MISNFQRIKSQYLNSQSDSNDLFSEIMRVAEEIGFDEALAYLEQCVTEKRLAWLKANFRRGIEMDNPVWEGYRWFYEKYLGVTVPEDGEIVEHADKRIIMRWWNSCPTLEACEQLGLETREICKKAYQKPVQEFLMQINPKLRFDRNYDYIRPHAAYCEEIIYLEE
jgi:hypothetical protein